MKPRTVWLGLDKQKWPCIYLTKKNVIRDWELMYFCPKEFTKVTGFSLRGIDKPIKVRITVERVK